jgi:NNP family nitrate/nitrite transporter-like MFS transporter
MTGSDVAWRIVCVIPAVLAFATGILMYFYTDDSPRGNYFEIKKADPTFKTRSPLSYFRAAVGNFNTWILFAHYASSSGIEVAFTAAAIDYYRETFGMPTEAAVAIANMFFWLEFFARPLGGLVSDLANNRWGMRGRLWVQATNLLLEGAFIMIFAVCQSVSGSIVVLIFFSLLVKMTKGSTFAVVPYVSPPNTGSVTGCTGAGGKVGALAFTLLFSGVPHSFALTCMGIVVFASALLTAGVSIRGHRGMFSGLDRNVDPETGELIITGASGARSSTQVDRVSSSCT